jgi:hypothetical protein
MQNRKEDFIEFLKTIKKEVNEWKSRYLWTSRIFVYSILLLLVIFVGAILFANFNLFHTDVTSARYMLSAVVQTQSAIVAIVITLTLIAVQLTASAYSPRVIDIFKKNPDMWLLLSCYGVSIFYGFIVLKLVEETEGGAVSQSVIWSLGPISISFESCVSMAYWLGAFTFVALFPYMWYIISLLKSENIIIRLANEITKDKILEYNKWAETSGGVEKRLVAGPIQPVVDIIHAAIMKYDLETTRFGLKAITDQVIKILGIKILGSDDEIKISEHFCSHLTRVGRLAISREDDGSTTEVIKNLLDFGESTAKKGLERATLHAIESLGEVGKAAVEKGFGDVTTQVAISLGEVGKAAVEKGLKVQTVRAILLLGEVGKAAVEKGFEDVTWQIPESLGEVGKVAAEKGLEVQTVLAALSLGEVGEAAAKKGLEVQTGRAALLLGEVGKAAAEKGLEDVTTKVAFALGGVGEAAVKKGLEDETSQVALSLGEVGKAAAEKGLEDVIALVIGYLGRVGSEAVKKGVEKAILQVARSLADVGEAAADKGLKHATMQAVMSLADVGKTAADRGLEHATEQAARSLAELTIVSEENIKTAIYNYKQALKKEDLNSFHKFWEIYKQELEKLQAEK